MDWQSLIREGNARLDEPDTANPTQAMENGIAAPRQKLTTAPTPSPSGTVQGNRDHGANAQNGHQLYASQIKPQLQPTHPPQLPAPQQSRVPRNPAGTTEDFDQQHAGRIFSQQHDARSSQLQDSINVGPLPRMPTHESQAHQTLREMAPKLQALLDLFVIAYETHDMEKVEELRRQLSWAIDAKGNRGVR